MNITLRVLIFTLGLLFVVFTFYLLARRKISERNSLLWLSGAAVTLLLSFFPGILDNIARLVGVDYPPALLFLVSTMITLAIVLQQAVQISILDAKVRELAQQIAVSEQLRIEGVLSLDRTTYHHRTPRHSREDISKEKRNARSIEQTSRSITS